MTSSSDTTLSDEHRCKAIQSVHANLAQLLPAAGSITVTATQLKGLQDAAVALQSLINDGGALLDACPPEAAAVASSLELLLQQLLEPAAAVFSGFGGAPCEPSQESEAAGKSCRETAAAQLQLVLLLLRQLGPLRRPAAATEEEEAQSAAAAAAAAREDGRERNRPQYVVGIVEIVEEDSSSNAQTAQQQVQARHQQLLLQVLLVCALYAQQDIQGALPALENRSSSKSSSSSSSSSRSSSSSSSQLPADLETFCSSVVLQGLILSTPWSSPACQQQCDHILQQLACTAAGSIPLEAPNAGHQQQQQGVAASLLQQQQQQGVGDSLFQQQQQQQQQGCWRQLLSLLLPQLLDCLRDTLMAQHRHNRVQDKGELGAYKGPDTFSRCLATRQLAWITQHLQPHPLFKASTPSKQQQTRSSSSTSQRQHKQPQDDQQQQQQQDQQLVGQLLPLLLAVTDDPSPSVQRYGQAGLGWLGLTGLASSSSSSSSSSSTPASNSIGSPNSPAESPGQQPDQQAAVHGRIWSAGHVMSGLSGLWRVRAASLAWHRVLLLDVARRLVVGCEEGSWAAAMPAATSLVIAVEGSGNVRSPAYHQLLQELITEAERSAHKPQQRLIFMGCLGRLLPCIGLYVLRHTSALMPLLLEWSHAYDEASAVAAVRLLGGVVRHAWPRMGVHAEMIWRHLVEVVRAAEERQWLKVGRQEGGAKATGAADSPARDVAEDAARRSTGVSGFGSSVLMNTVLDVVGLLVRCCAGEFAAAAATAAVEMDEVADGCSWVGQLLFQIKEIQRAYA